jgi:hypothetical protein
MRLFVKRPWKVRWYSLNYNEYYAKSFAYEEKAHAFAQRLENLGFWEVLVWKNDEKGYVDTETLTVYIGSLNKEE